MNTAVMAPSNHMTNNSALLGLRASTVAYDTHCHVNPNLSYITATECPLLIYGPHHLQRQRTLEQENDITRWKEWEEFIAWKGRKNIIDLSHRACDIFSEVRTRSVAITLPTTQLAYSVAKVTPPYKARRFPLCFMLWHRTVWQMVINIRTYKKPSVSVFIFTLTIVTSRSSEEMSWSRATLSKNGW